MKRERRWILIIALCLLATVSAWAETYAVSVRLSSAPEDEPIVFELLADVEEGAMDVFFGGGHIIFDVDVEGVSESSWHESVNAARTGGATYLLLVDVAFALEGDGEVVPTEASVSLVDVNTEEHGTIGRVVAADLSSTAAESAEELSMRVGSRAAEVALSEIREGGKPW
jgi:hypothetical protein